MIVAVGDFNMGAMENKGLNIFNTKYVLANPGDRHRRRLRRHRERGRPRVLPQLDRQPRHLPRLVPAVAEGRPDGLPRPGVQPGHGRHASARAVKRIEDVRVLRTAQFPEDAGPMAHPVRPDSYVEINNFYTVTVYEKGAEVVRMMQTLVGRDGFAQGHDAVLRAPRRPGRDLRRLRAGDRRCQPRQRAGAQPDAVQALVQPGRHAARDARAAATTPPTRSYTLSLAQTLRAHAGPAEQAAASDPGGDRACSAATGARCRCSSRARPHRSATERVLVLDEPSSASPSSTSTPSRCLRCCAASRRR